MHHPVSRASKRTLYFEIMLRSEYPPSVHHSQEERLPAEDEDGPGRVVDAHLVVKDEVRAAHGRRVVRDQRPTVRRNVVHVEITLQKRD